MIAFGLASMMLCAGMVIRTKVSFIQNMLVPASVIAGVLGFIVMNTGFITSTNTDMYVDMVEYIFTITFISLALTSHSKSKSHKKNVAKGSLGLGLIWDLLYAFTPAVGALIILGIGGFFGMKPVYGLLIPFAFAQGPGQAVTFGSIMEQQYGIAHAATVGIAFAAIGFLLCFLIGVPLARYGIKKGLAKNLGTSKIVKRGYYKKEDHSETLGKETMFSGNMDTMTFHFAIIGLCFILALGMAKLVSFIPGVGATFGGMLFVYGMFAGYIVRFVMKRLHIDDMLDNTFQSRITGLSTDYLVVSSFMAVPLGLISDWMVPIIIESIVIALLSIGVCIYFGQRFGGENDFERTVGLFGTSTGTVPSGLALVRIIDPSFKTPTAVELGLMNIVMAPSYVTVMTILGIASGVLSWSVGVILLLAPIPIYLILLQTFRVWNARTYHLKQTSTTNTTRGPVKGRPEPGISLIDVEKVNQSKVNEE